MPIVKIKLDLVLLPHEVTAIRSRFLQLRDDRILVSISDITDPIRGRDRILGYPPPTEYAIELRATSPSQMETVCDLLMEFGTPLQKDKHRAASLLSRVAQEANVEAGFPVSPTDTMKALKAALGNGASTWHGLVRKKLHEWFRSNDV